MFCTLLFYMHRQNVFVVVWNIDNDTCTFLFNRSGIVFAHLFVIEREQKTCGILNKINREFYGIPLLTVYYRLVLYIIIIKDFEKFGSPSYISFKKDLMK